MSVSFEQAKAPLARTGKALCRMAARAESLARFRGSSRQQTPEDFRTGAMHRAANQHLDRFQIDLARFAATSEHYLEQGAYFLGDFLLNRFGRFFSCGVKVSSSGRKRHSCSFTWMKT